MDGSDRGVNPDENSRITEWADNVERALKTLSATSRYRTLEYNDETGPGMFVIQRTDWRLDDLAEKEDPNAWDDIERDLYLDQGTTEIYRCFEDSAIVDEAMLIMADGQPLDHNFYMEVPDNVWENVNTEDEEGAKHKNARAVSDMENVAWTRY